MHIDLVELIRAVGYLGIFAIVFSESGLLIGVLFPGDSLLFTAGFLASQGHLYLPTLAATCVIAAIAGDAVGYAFGKKVGRKLFERPDSRYFRREHLLAAERFYERYGAKAIVLARFLPIVRTFAPIVAGVGLMRYRRFAIYNALGALLWGGGVTTAGYALGQAIPDIDRYLVPAILAIILVSTLPTLVHLYRSHGDKLRVTLRERWDAARGGTRAGATSTTE